MVDLVITAANVVAGVDAVKESGTWGETVTAGKVVYKDPTTGRYLLADNNVAGKQVPRGIALNGGSNGQPGVIQKSGGITIGATLTPGTTYYLSDTPGGICPLADVAVGENVAIVGLAASASVLTIALVGGTVTL